MPPTLKGEMRPPGPSQQAEPAPVVHHPPAEGLKGDWDWLHFAAQLPAKVITLPSLSANTLLYSGRCILVGGSFQNNGGGTGIMNLRDAVDNTGEYVGIYPLAAGGSANPTFGNAGIILEIGLWAEIATATLRGALYIIPLWHYRFTTPGL